MRPARYCIGAFLAVFGMAPLGAQAPTGTIRGRVTQDATGLPLSGVLVSFGPRNTQTRADGQYVLAAAPAGTDSLRARLIGYAPAARSDP